jgi:hypothetical protein
VVSLVFLGLCCLSQLFSFDGLPMLLLYCSIIALSTALFIRA